MKKSAIAGLGALMLVAGYAGWSRAGRAPPAGAPDLKIAETRSVGEAEASAGNLLGIQPWMEASDYASEERFFAKLDGYMKAAAREKLLGPRTVVVFPEYTASWLVGLGEKTGVYEATTLDQAMQLLVASNLFSFARHAIGAEGADAAKYALFRMKADVMAAAYERVFSRLAREHRVTVVAGSIVLPEPRIEAGRLVVGGGPLYNTSLVFAPDGRPHASVVRKVFPISDELSFTSRGGVEDLPVFDTPAGRLGVLICADAWFPESYDVLRKKNVELVAVPSYVAPEGHWDTKWKGYNGFEAPADVDRADYGRIAEREAWLKYAMSARLKASGARAGLNVFLRGRFWDLGADGGTIAALEGQVIEGPRVDGGALLNVWVGRGDPGAKTGAAPWRGRVVIGWNF